MVAETHILRVFLTSTSINEMYWLIETLSRVPDDVKLSSLYVSKYRGIIDTVFTHIHERGENPDLTVWRANTILKIDWNLLSADMIYQLFDRYRLHIAMVLPAQKLTEIFFEADEHPEWREMTRRVMNHFNYKPIVGQPSLEHGFGVALMNGTLQGNLSRSIWSGSLSPRGIITPAMGNQFQLVIDYNDGVCICVTVDGTRDDLNVALNLAFCAYGAAQRLVITRVRYKLADVPYLTHEVTICRDAIPDEVDDLTDDLIENSNFMPAVPETHVTDDYFDFECEAEIPLSIIRFAFNGLNPTRRAEQITFKIVDLNITFREV